MKREVFSDSYTEATASAKSNGTYLFSDVLPSYRKMGLTENEISEYRQKGLYFDVLKDRTDSDRMGFYGRVNFMLNRNP